LTSKVSVTKVSVPKVSVPKVSVPKVSVLSQFRQRTDPGPDNESHSSEIYSGGSDGGSQSVQSVQTTNDGSTTVSIEKKG
jgi:hypothetical protein